MHTAQFALRYPLYLWPNVDLSEVTRALGKSDFCFPEIKPYLYTFKISLLAVV